MCWHRQRVLVQIAKRIVIWVGVEAKPKAEEGEIDEQKLLFLLLMGRWVRCHRHRPGVLRWRWLLHLMWRCQRVEKTRWKIDRLRIRLVELVVEGFVRMTTLTDELEVGPMEAMKVGGEQDEHLIFL